MKRINPRIIALIIAIILVFCIRLSVIILSVPAAVYSDGAIDARLIAADEKVLWDAVVCYVAPDGSDEAAGTIAKPFATMEAARKAFQDVNYEGIMEVLKKPKF